MLSRWYATQAGRSKNRSCVPEAFSSPQSLVRVCQTGSATFLSRRVIVMLSGLGACLHHRCVNSLLNMKTRCLLGRLNDIVAIPILLIRAGPLDIHSEFLRSKSEHSALPTGHAVLAVEPWSKYKMPPFGFLTWSNRRVPSFQKGIWHSEILSFVSISTGRIAISKPTA